MIKNEKIIVKVDVTMGCVLVKRGLFGKVRKFRSEWYTDSSMNDIIKEFCKLEIEEFSKNLSKIVRQTY